MEYKISKLRPTVYDRVIEAFKVPTDFESGLVFCCYPYIHVYAGYLRADLEVHEMVHYKRQENTGSDWWWEKYITDEKFRLNEELMAYRAQYQWVLKNTQSNKHFFYLKDYATQLTTLYNIKGINLIMAMNMIKNTQKK